MKNICNCFILFALSLIWLTSCEKKNINYDSEPEWLSKTYPEYDQERQVIYFKEQLNQDIKGNIDVPFDINNPKHVEFACEFSFYNYGGDIRLFNGCIDDCFIDGIGTISCAYALESEDDITINSKRHSEKYGDWALVSLNIKNTYINDVYMTPLSMKAHKEGETSGYIFIQFVTKNKYMNVLFYGGPRECLVVGSCPNVIIRHRKYATYDNEIEKGYSGQFWHQINSTNY